MDVPEICIRGCTIEVFFVEECILNEPAYYRRCKKPSPDLVRRKREMERHRWGDFPKHWGETRFTPKFTAGDELEEAVAACGNSLETGDWDETGEEASIDG